LLQIFITKVKQIFSVLNRDSTTNYGQVRLSLDIPPAASWAPFAWAVSKKFLITDSYPNSETVVAKTPKQCRFLQLRGAAVIIKEEFFVISEDDKRDQHYAHYVKKKGFRIFT
jgi:hypothetical protein